MEPLTNLGMGYLRDLPDMRDYHAETDSVRKVLKASKPLKEAMMAAPAAVDLRGVVLADRGSGERSVRAPPTPGSG